MLDLPQQLRRDIEALCSIGPRASRLGTLDAARDWLVERIGPTWSVDVQGFDAPGGLACNLEIRHPDTPPRPAETILLIGAHYDTVPDAPGADDNASAVATLLHMLDALRDLAGEDRVRFALYANEEPPYFQTKHMGSHVHAKHCFERDWPLEMLCLESLGYFSDEPNSQRDPTTTLPRIALEQVAAAWDLQMQPNGGLLGDVGDFVALEADLESADLLRRLRAGYDEADAAPVRQVGAALPRNFCSGLSDHWSYWQLGYAAVMATDTALFRNPNYHRPTDTPATLDVPRLAAVATRLTAAARAAATRPSDA
jgi:hypothetical protein